MRSQLFPSLRVLAFTISIANGAFGYMPTPEQHKLGGYESWLGTNRVEFVLVAREEDGVLNSKYLTQRAKVPSPECGPESRRPGDQRVARLTHFRLRCQRNLRPCHGNVHVSETT